MHLTKTNKQGTKELTISFYRDPGSETNYTIAAISIFELSKGKRKRIASWDSIMNMGEPYPIDLQKYVADIKQYIADNAVIK